MHILEFNSFVYCQFIFYDGYHNDIYDINALLCELLKCKLAYKVFCEITIQKRSLSINRKICRCVAKFQSKTWYYVKLGINYNKLSTDEQNQKALILNSIKIQVNLMKEDNM